MHVEIESSDGFTRLGEVGPHDPDALIEDAEWTTALGRGFGDCTVLLRYPISPNDPLVAPFRTLRVVADDGVIEYEGEIEQPSQDNDGLSIKCVGHWVELERNQFRQLFLNRNPEQWEGPSDGRRAVLESNNFTTDGSVVTTDGSGRGGAAVGLKFTGAWASPAQPNSEGTLDAGPGLKVAKIIYSGQKSASIGLPDANWVHLLRVAATDDLAGSEDSINLLAAATWSGTEEFDTPARFASAVLRRTTTNTGVNGREYSVTLVLTAVGDHGLDLVENDEGFLGINAMDLIRHIVGRYAPLIDTSDTADTDLVVVQSHFREATRVAEAIANINDELGYDDIGVWEDRRLRMRAVDLSEPDLVARPDEPGVDWVTDGPSTQAVRNGVVVTYQDVATGQQNVLHPDDEETLRDDSIENLATREGKTAYEPITIANPTSKQLALNLGRTALRVFNQRQRPATLSAQGPIDGTPASRVRAGLVVADGTDPHSENRVVWETSYRRSSDSVTASLGQPLPDLDTLIDRLQRAA